ncbi:MAG: LysM peptidoglycan-binding domain-containing protein [Gemmataceae bacterium]
MGKSIDPPGIHIVQQGDWLSKIAHWYNVPDWQTIWNHGNNAGLRARRKNPNIIYPGDEIFIPGPENKEDPKPTDQHHRYLLRRTMATLTIRVLDERDRPRAGEPYHLIIHEWKEFSGALDGDGQLHHEIPATAEEGRLFLFPPQRPEEEQSA